MRAMTCIANVKQTKLNRYEEMRPSLPSLRSDIQKAREWLIDKNKLDRDVYSPKEGGTPLKLDVKKHIPLNELTQHETSRSRDLEAVEYYRFFTYGVKSRVVPIMRGEKRLLEQGAIPEIATAVVIILWVRGIRFVEKDGDNYTLCSFETALERVKIRIQFMGPLFKNNEELEKYDDDAKKRRRSI